MELKLKYRTEFILVLLVDKMSPLLLVMSLHGAVVWSSLKQKFKEKKTYVLFRTSL